MNSKDLLAAEGRDPSQVLILPGFSPIIGSTEAEAKRFSDELNDLSDPEVGRDRLSLRFGGADLSHLPLDKPLASEDLPDPALNEASRSRTQVIVDFVREQRPTLRQLLAKLAGARGHFVFEGTPDQVADLMEDWVTGGVGRRLQSDAAGASGDARRVCRRSRANSSKARAVSNALRRQYVALSLRLATSRQHRHAVMTLARRRFIGFGRRRRGDGLSAARGPWAKLSWAKLSGSPGAHHRAVCARRTRPTPLRG